jgi:hypothetical protein
VPGSTFAGRVHLPSLAAELTDGWTVSEAATLVSPSGTEIHMKLGRVPDGWTAADVADEMESATRAARPGINGAASRTATMRSGIVADDRRLEFEREGVQWVGRLISSVNAGIALTLRASWPATNGAGDADVDTALAGVRLLSHPISASPLSPEAATPAVRAKRPPVDAAAWAGLRSQWVASRTGGSTGNRATQWSAAELAVFATILGSSSFPTVGSELLGSLPEAGLAATLEWVTRSLLARGLIEPGPNGSTQISEELREIMEVAVFPDLTISAERLRGSGARGWWFGLRPDRAVQVTVSVDGSRECAMIEPADVVDRLSHLIESCRGGGETLVRVTTAWRDGDLIRGGTFTVQIGEDGALALTDLEPQAGSASFASHATDAEGLRTAVLENLPG